MALLHLRLWIWIRQLLDPDYRHKPDYRKFLQERNPGTIPGPNPGPDS